MDGDSETMDGFPGVPCKALEWFRKRTGTSFQNGKARGSSGHESNTTSGDGVASLATSLGRHLVGFPVLIKTPWICPH